MRAAVILCCLAMLTSCKQSAHGPGEHTTVLQRVRQTQATLPSPWAFSQLRQWPKKDYVQVKAALGIHRTFYTTRRKNKIARYPCSTCHQGHTLMRGQASVRFQLTHGKIRINHASAGVLKCSSCHDANRMDQLRTPTGEYVSFDQVYKLCASCHKSRVRDWIGGAHGKRVKAWAGTRAVFNCTACHNPHDPLAHFGKRWPATTFRLPQR